MSERSPPKGRPSSPCEQAAAQTYGEENEHGEGPNRPRSLARRVYQWAERRRCSTHGGWRRAALGLVRRWRHRLPAAWHRHGLQGRGPDRRVPPRDPGNDRGVGIWPKDLRPHPWVGWQTPLGCTGLCCQQLGPTTRVPQFVVTRDGESGG